MEKGEKGKREKVEKVVIASSKHQASDTGPSGLRTSNITKTDYVTSFHCLSLLADDRLRDYLGFLFIINLFSIILEHLTIAHYPQLSHTDRVFVYHQLQELVGKSFSALLTVLTRIKILSSSYLIHT